MAKVHLERVLRVFTKAKSARTAPAVAAAKGSRDARVKA
jgi:hypothetical protein